MRTAAPDESKTMWLHSPEPFEFKFAGDEGADAKQCVVEGYASLWDLPDQGNDYVAKGAFDKSLNKRRNPKGQWLIPMYFGHVHNSVPVGVWTDITPDSKGLKVKGPILIESDPARQLAAVLRAGGGMGLSIGYTTVKRKYVSPEGRELDEWVSGSKRRLDEVDLREISFTPMPMLDAARLTSVKGDDLTGEEAEARAAEEAKAAPIRAMNFLSDHLRTKAAFRALADAMKS